MKTKLTIAGILVLSMFVITGCIIEGDAKEDPSAAADTSAAATSDTIKIGVLMPFSGTLVCTGNYRKAAAELAAMEINRSGIFDKQIEIVAEDDETDPDKGVAAAGRLLEQGVLAIVGSAASSVTIKTAEEVSIPNGILQISPSSTSPRITSIIDNGLLWRTAPSDVYQGKIAADYAYDTLGKTTASIIYVDTAYGQGLAGSFKSEFEALGGAVLNSVAYPEMTSGELALYDFSANASTLFSGNPELIYLVTYYLDGAKITLAAKPYITDTYKPQFVGVDGNYGSVFLANADQDVVEGMVGTAPTPPSSDANYANFALNYKAMFDLDPPIYTANTYDAVYLIAYAMLKANSIVSKDIADRLLEVSKDGETVGVGQFADGKAKILNGVDINYDGASGKVDFDGNGDVTSGSYLVWKVEDGEFVEQNVVSFDETGILNSAAPSPALLRLMPSSKSSALCPQ